MFNQYLRLNISSTTATLETEENGRCRQVFKQELMNGFFCRSGREKVAVVEVAVSGVSTALEEITKPSLNHNEIKMFFRHVFLSPGM